MIKIERHLDATFLNSVANNPVVRPDIDETPEGYLDLSHVAANQDHVVLMGEHGGIVFVKMFAGVYEAHSLVLPEGRGAWALEFALAAADWMFTKTDAFEITTRAPETHRGAIRLAEKIGMMFEFERPGCKWRGIEQKALIYSYRIQDWARVTTSFDQPGHDFHDFLHAEAKRIGHPGEQHADDPNHNRYVAMAIAMVQAGHVYKALQFFNRWSILARVPMIWKVSDAPLTFRIDIGHLVFENDTMRVEPVDVAA